MIYQTDRDRREVVLIIAKHASIVAVLDTLESLIRKYADIKALITETDAVYNKFFEVEGDKAALKSQPFLLKESAEKLRQVITDEIAQIENILIMLNNAKKSAHGDMAELPTYDAINKIHLYNEQTYSQKKCDDCFYNWLCTQEGSYRLTKEADSVIKTYQENLKKPHYELRKTEPVNGRELTRVLKVMELQTTGQSIPEHMLKPIQLPIKNKEDQAAKVSKFVKGEWRYD
jgi:hypothetical protein